MITRKIFFAAVLLLAACNSGEKANNNTDSSAVNSSTRGNSDGSNIIGTDTARMDTSLGKITADSAR